MPRRRCVHCNYENEEGAIYCRRCKKLIFVGGSSSKVTAMPSVWEISNSQTAASTISGSAVSASAAETDTAAVRTKISSENLVVICPDCGYEEPVINGRIPLFCTMCNYYFQKSDRPVPKGQKRTVVTNDASKAPQNDLGTSAVSAPSDSRRPLGGPMRRRNRVADRSSLRLIGLNDSCPFAIAVRPEGEYFGSQERKYAQLFARAGLKKVAAQHLFFFHKEIGWYMRTLDGYSFHNNLQLNNGIEIRLSDGDNVVAGDCRMRIEIVSQNE